MIQILDKQTGQSVGSLTDEQFQFLADNLEEESRQDDDYYLNRATIDLLEEQGAPPELVAVLRTAIGSLEETEIRWQRT
jgi:processive 1,2-diacylglycerol beta-glucosyltransferase